LRRYETNKLFTEVIIEKCHHCVGSQACQNQVVNECLPVGAFGNVSGKSVKAAIIGLNPALNEFFHSDYKTIKSRSQRLAVLGDYNLTSRADLQEADIDDAKKRRAEYFISADREWHSHFEKLESLISRIQPLWSFVSGRVVHIDLVACATQMRWNDLSDDCQKELITNCRGHFLATLSLLPTGTMLLLDGSRVISEIKKLDLIFEQDGGEQPINIQWNRGCVGKLKWGEKEFPFRGWSIPVGKLSQFWRYDLAAWVCGTFKPPLPFLPVAKLP
jgi:hypothetical protein